MSAIRTLGGGVALRTAIQHPQVMRKLVLIATTFKRDGLYPEVLAAMDQMGPQVAGGMRHSPLSQLYPNADWPGLFTKLADRLRQKYDWPNDVAGMKAPTMIVFADADAIGPAHIIEFFELLGGGRKDAGLDGSGKAASQLAILPGFTHYNILACPALAPLLTAFLDTPMPIPGKPKEKNQR